METLLKKFISESVDGMESQITAWLNEEQETPKPGHFDYTANLTRYRISISNSFQMHQVVPQKGVVTLNNQQAATVQIVLFIFYTKTEI